MRRIPSLDGLRAISIFLVVVGHWAGLNYGSPIPVSYAFLGVRIFFVISGYLITTLLLKEWAQTAAISLREFYVRRAYRILPAATVFLFTMFIARRHELTRFHAIMAILYLADFDPTRPVFFGHLWSLSVEEQFYLVWPSVLKKWYAHRVRILLAVIAIGPVYQLVTLALHFPETNHTFFAVADNLSVGCLLAIAAPRIPMIPRWLGLLMAVMIGLIVSFEGSTRTRTLILLFVLWPLLYAAIAGVLLHVVQTPYRILNAGPVVWLGRVSYSLYLWQQIFVFERRSHPWYFIVFAICTASLSYYLVEQPMLRLREKRASMKKTKATQFFDVSSAGQPALASMGKNSGR